MKRLSTLMLGAGLLTLAAPGAWAQALVNARVLSSTPMLESVPVTSCAPAVYGQPTGGGAAVGALVGGLVGSQLGHGSGHIAGAILGTLGGAFVGNAVEAQQVGRGRCQTVYQQRLTGYDVRYELGGRSYQTQLSQAPGAWIQVPVAGGYPGPSDANEWGGYGDAAPVQTYPVAQPPMAAYELPADPAWGDEAPVGVVTAPPAYPQAVAPAYPSYPPYTQPVGRLASAPPAPVWVMPLGVNLSVGGGFGHRGRGGWGVSVGNAW